MRLFIAVKPGEGFTRALAEAQERLKSAGVRGNYTKKENLHITLAFIGEYSDPARVLGVMQKVPFTPFRIAPEGTGSFGGVLWAGIKGGAALAAYTKRLRAALAENGIPFDKKPFSPHITLLREPRGELPGIALSPAEFTARRVSLFRSERCPDGMIYTELGHAEAGF